MAAAPAPTQPAAPPPLPLPPAADGVAAMIAQRERELAQLRADSVAALEQQVAARDAALRQLAGRLDSLQSDFEYNLGLLGGRDQELARCEAALAAAGSELAVQHELVAQMQAALGEAEQALASEHAARMAAERQLAQQRRTLLAEVQAARAEGDVAVRRVQHQADVQQRQLEEELDRRVAAAAEQQAAAAAAHAAALQQLEAAHASQLRELQLRAEVAEQLAVLRDAEVTAADQRLRQEAAQVATLQAAAAAQAKELQAAQDGRVAVEQQLAAVRRDAAAQLTELGRAAEALRNALEDQRADGGEALRRVQEELGGRLTAAQREAAEARAEAAKLGSELEDARAALEVQHAALQQQLDRICAEQEAQLAELQQAAAAEQQREQQRLAAALADAQHERQVLAERHGALQDHMEQQQEELAAAREELGKAAATRDQLQAQLDAAERRAAVLAAGQGPSLPELEGMLRRLSGQRDAAQAAAADAQARLEQREADMAALQQRVTQLDRAAVAGEASSRFSWPTGLSSSESLEVPAAAAPVGAGDLAALREALEAERQQSAHLQAALRALTADMQRLKQEQQHLAVVPASLGGALADVTNAPQQQDGQQQQVQRLTKQLVRAQARLRQLVGENERLMEMSNSLRAERNRLAGAARQAGGAASACTEVAVGAAGLLQPAAAALPTCTPPLQWPLLAPTAGSLFNQLLASAAGCSPNMLQHLVLGPPQEQQQQQQQEQQAHCLQTDQQRPVVARQPVQGSSLVAPGQSGSSEPDMALVGQSLLPHAGPVGDAAAATHTRRAALRIGSKQQRVPEAVTAACRQSGTPSPPRVRNWNNKSP